MTLLLYFIIRYIPFWSVPVLIIVAPAFMIFWRKEHRITALAFLSIGGFSLFSLIFWIWAGGPDRSVGYFQEFVDFLTR